MPMKKGRIPVGEVSPPPSDSESDPDSEALMRRRWRDGFPFQEAVTLLEKFLKEANERIEETDKEYSRPGKALTMEEISALDRKMLGLGAIIRRVGDKMKKLEEDCWKEIEEIMEGGGRGDDRTEKNHFFSQKTNDFPYQMDPSFDALAPFAKSFAIKKEENADVQEEETCGQVGGNVVTQPSDRPQATGLRRLEHHKETVEGHAEKAQPKVQKRKRDWKQLEGGLNKGNDDPEVKKEVKEEVEEEMDEGGEASAKDRSNGVGKEALKRREKENPQEKGAPGATVNAKNGKSSEVVVKEEEREDVVPSEEPPVEREKDGGPCWKVAKIHAKPKRRPSFPVDDCEVDLHPKEENEPVKRRKTEGYEDDRDYSGGVDVGQLEEKEHMDGMMDFGGMDSDFNDTESPAENVSEGDGEEKEKSVRRSLLLSKQIKDAMERGGDGHFSDKDGEGSTDSEEQRKRIGRSGRCSSDDGIGDETAGGDSIDGDEEMDQSVDKDDLVNDGSDEKKCPVDGCIETLSSSEDLVEHMRKHPAPFLCGVCKSSWPSGFKLRRHYMKHTGEKSYKCDGCKKSFAEKGHLRVHQRVHTAEKPYRCTICKKNFTQSSHLNSHLRIHTGERPFECDICGHKTRDFSALKVHRRNHTGEHPYKCDLCDYKTSIPSHLTEHKRIHTGEKPYPCTICNKRFAHSSHLTVHMRVHTGEKPYKCECCEYAASNISSLNKHVRIHTGEKPFSCATCGYKTALSGSLSKHKKRHSH